VSNILAHKLRCSQNKFPNIVIGLHNGTIGILGKEEGKHQISMKNGT